MSSPPRLRWQLLAATLARAVTNTAHRMVYPFLPELSRGLGVSSLAITQMISARSALGMAAPLFGPLPDRAGRRTTMLLAMLVFALGLGLVALFPGYLTVFAAVLLVVVTKFLFDPALQAYLGDRTPYAQRGLVIALTELGWSGAALVGIPLAGLLIARTGNWTAPFGPLAVLGLLSALGLWLLIPSDAERVRARTRDTRPAHWSAVWRNPAVLAALVVGLLTAAAIEVLTVVYGSWLEQAFGLKVAERGFTLILIGIAEVVGEVLVMLLADRLGKRRVILGGVAVSAATYFALPLMAVNITLALVGLFFVFAAFEFTIVATIPYMTEFVPHARGAVLSANVAFHYAGHMLGALAGGWLFALGFFWNGAAAAAVNVVALVVIVAFVREHS